MTKTRAFPLIGVLFAAVAPNAWAGPPQPCDDRIVVAEGGSWVSSRPELVRQVVAEPAIVQSTAQPTVVTIPPGSAGAIRQGWAGNTPMRISAPANAPAMVARGYQPAWVDADSAVVVGQVHDEATCGSSIVIPSGAVVAQNSLVEPFDAHDRLVVLNEFTRPGSNDRAILYRDATGLLHESVIDGRQSRVFYDHLGRRCLYDRDASTVVVLDGRVVRDYNRNGVCDDERYIDRDRRAELDFHRSTLYKPPSRTQPHRSVATPYRPPLERIGRDSGSQQRSRTEPRSTEIRRSGSDRPTGSAVNGRTQDQSRLTGGERKSTRSAIRPKR